MMLEQSHKEKDSIENANVGAIEIPKEKLSLRKLKEY